MRINSEQLPKTRLASRLNVLKTVFFLIGAVVVWRLFSLQIIKSEHYTQLAKGVQFKQLEIEPERGGIYFMDGEEDRVAATVNESRYTVFADPFYVKDKELAASELSGILNISKDEIMDKLVKDTRYSIIAKKIYKDVLEKVSQKGLKGIAWKEERIRTYPQGNLGGQVLGFVNDEGEGQYGVEGYLNTELSGISGQIRAVTDIQGTPLMQNEDNIVKEAIDGSDVVLSIDQTMQRILEDEIKNGVEKSADKSGSAIIVEADSGKIKAMAGFPSYSPSTYTEVTDQNLYKNQAVSDPLEPGSIIKTLLVGASIDAGTITKDSTYYDSGVQTIDGISVRNLTPLAPGTRSVYDILQYSLNTGAIELVKKFGDGDVNESARNKWFQYLSDKYHFTDESSIEVEEATVGFIPRPDEGDGLRIQYANMAFGQGFTVTIQQFASALAAAVNGGTYYKPTIINSIENDSGTELNKPEIIQNNVISKSASYDLIDLMTRYERDRRPNASRDGFIIGGKTGTAQVPGSDGKYREDVFNATFAGFIGKSKPKYIVVVRLNEGKASENFSGFEDARPVFLGVANSIMDNVPFTD